MNGILWFLVGLLVGISTTVAASVCIAASTVWEEKARQEARKRAQADCLAYTPERYEAPGSMDRQGQNSRTPGFFAE